MRIDDHDAAREKCSQQINIRELSYGKAAKEKRISYNFDDIVGGQYEKEKNSHPSNPRRLPGTNFEESPNTDDQSMNGQHRLHTPGDFSRDEAEQNHALCADRVPALNLLL